MVNTGFGSQVKKSECTTSWFSQRQKQRRSRQYNLTTSSVGFHAASASEGIRAPMEGNIVNHQVPMPPKRGLYST
ncbi:hypothetical protein MTO96_014240 [Rhipicephalus appendiculatus]